MIRSTRYLATLAAIAVGLTVFFFFGFDPLADWIGLTKGEGFLLAFVLLAALAVAWIGLLVDAALLAGSRLLKMEAACG